MKLREKCCEWMFEVSKKPYAFLFKQRKTPWNLNANDLLKYPTASLGKAVGHFLKKNDFELIDCLESHDVYHVLTGMSTSVRDEVGMQFLLMGNGKRSVYLYATICICAILLPEYFQFFRKCYKTGKNYQGIHHLNLLNELQNPIEEVRDKCIRPIAFSINSKND